MRAAIADVAPHVQAWISLLEAHIATLPPDRVDDGEQVGCFDRSYAEHELRAMKRDLAALIASAT